MRIIETERVADRPAPAQPLRVVVLEPDRLMRALVVEWLQLAGHDVRAIESHSPIQHARYDLALADVPASIHSARETLVRLSAAAPAGRVIAMSAGVPIRGASGARALAHELGVSAVLVKPFSQDDLLKAIGHA